LKKAVKAETVTLRHLAITLAESNGLPKIEVNPLLMGMSRHHKHLRRAGASALNGRGHPPGAQAAGAHGPQPGHGRGHQDQGQQESRFRAAKDLKEAV